MKCVHVNNFYVGQDGDGSFVYPDDSYFGGTRIKEAAVSPEELKAPPVSVMVFAGTDTLRRGDGGFQERGQNGLVPFSEAS